MVQGTAVRRRRGAFGAVLGVLVTLTAVLQASPAAAAVTVSPIPSFPSIVAVGQVFPASLVIVATANGPDATLPVVISDIVLVPACTMTTTNNCAGGVDPGVFSLSPTGTGGASCAGKTFTITQSSPGVFTFAPSSAISLTSGQTCSIQFSATALKMPSVDINPGTPGAQAGEAVFATGTGASTAGVRNVGVTSTTVTRAVPTITTAASSSSAQIGQSISDTATLSGGTSPTGTVTFQLFNDAACSGPSFFQSTVPVVPGQGSATATSGPFAVTSPGTYHWVASYSGDANNSAAGPTACQDPQETVGVGRANSLITTVATPATSTVGTPVRDTATVDGGVNPTGTVTFRLFSDPGCTTQVFTSTNPLNGSRVATSGNFVTTIPGTYRWVATYSGDANNTPAGPTSCGDPLETVSATVRPPVRQPADFDGDSRSDVSIFRPSNGGWFVRGSAGSDMGIVYGGVPGDVAVPADYDGDGKTDVAIYRPGSSAWFVHGSAGVDSGVIFGSPGDTPVPGDYDGDGKVDLAVYRAGTGTWLIHGSAGVDWSVAYGGLTGDVPVPADYDGDGRADVAIYRPGNGGWFVRGSAGTDVGIVYGGLAGDVPVPGDYDGDGRADVAIYRQSNSAWFIHGSAGVDQGLVFGVPGDRPVPGDYDGDRKTDVAVYRPTTGAWFIHGSAGTDRSVVYGGVAGDVALPLPPAVRRAYYPGG